MDTSDEKYIIILNAKDFKALLKSSISQDDWVTLPEAARLLGVSTGKINQMRYNRQITYTQTSERVFMYERKSIEEILERHKQEAINKTDY